MSTTAPMLGPDDKLRFIEDHRPGLKAGDYELVLKQTVTLNGHPEESQVEAASTTAFSVAGERFSIAKQEVHSVYPPPNSPGHYEKCLPHIALLRSTLPWERSPRSDAEALETPTWLALLVLPEDHTGSSIIKAKDLKQQKPGVKFPAITLERLNDPEENVHVIDLQWKQLRERLPCIDDLRHLAHVRAIEPVSGQTHSEVAFVIGTQSPPAGQNSVIHLVSMEGRFREMESGFDDGAIELPLEGSGAADLKGLLKAAQLAAMGKRVEVELKADCAPKFYSGTEIPRYSGPLPKAEIQQMTVASIGHIGVRHTKRLCQDESGKRRQLGVWILDLPPAMRFFDARSDNLPALVSKAVSEVRAGASSVTMSDAKAQIEALQAEVPDLNFGIEFALENHSGALVQVEVDTDRTKCTMRIEAIQESVDAILGRWLREARTAKATRLEIAEPMNAGREPEVSGYSDCTAKAVYPANSWDANRIEKTCSALLTKDWQETFDETGEVEVSGWFEWEGSRNSHRLSLHLTESKGATLALEPGKRVFFDSMGASDEDLVRLVSLHHWTVECESSRGDFLAIAEDVMNRGGEFRVSIGKTPTSAEERIAHQRLGDGYVPLVHNLRNGDRTVSWYRGPLCHSIREDAEEASKPLPARCADELMIADPSTGMLDATYAAAWELGRQLALADRHFSLALYAWKRAHRHELARARQWIDCSYLPSVHQEPQAPGLTGELGDWLDALARLEGVPASYLIPNKELLPEESLRRVVLDPAWIACLRDGAFSIGRVVASDVTADAGHSENWPAPPRISGILLRSRLVRDYPTLAVQAFFTANQGADWEKEPHLGGLAGYRKLTPLRMSRISPDVLLCLFVDANEPPEAFNVLELHLPPEVLHFGFERDVDRHLKDRTTGKLLTLAVYGKGDSTDKSFSELTLDTPDLLKVKAALLKMNAKMPESEADLLRLVDYYIARNPGTEKIPGTGPDLDSLRLNKPMRWAVEGNALKRDLDALFGEKHQVPLRTQIRKSACRMRIQRFRVSEELLRQSNPAVLRADALYARIADQLRPAMGDQAVTSADFALQMVSMPPLCRIRFQRTDS